jgi:hypothetical protein
MDCWNIGMLEYGTQIHYSIILRYRLHMSLFKRFFFSLLVLTLPGLVFGAATPVRIKIASLESGIKLWTAVSDNEFRLLKTDQIHKHSAGVINGMPHRLRA